VQFGRFRKIYFFMDTFNSLEIASSPLSPGTEASSLFQL
jgi:hypothetical protein